MKTRIKRRMTKEIPTISPAGILVGESVPRVVGDIVVGASVGSLVGAFVGA
jgi:hypothetical protein